MVDQDNQPPGRPPGHSPAHSPAQSSEDFDVEKPGAKAEAQVFAAIVRYLAERLTDVEPDVDPGDLVATGELFVEIAEAFENTSGFEFSSDQALPLSHAFAMLEGGMRILAEQAHESGHTNAAAKMEWAALKARTMTATLETHHLEQSHGIIAFDLEDDADNDNAVSD
jgi:hypothetical protein